MTAHAESHPHFVKGKVPGEKSSKPKAMKLAKAAQALKMVEETLPYGIPSTQH